MLCCICVIDGQDTKAVTYFQGTSVCHDHAIAMGKNVLADRLRGLLQSIAPQKKES
jgi:hypothetical protein